MVQVSQSFKIQKVGRNISRFWRMFFFGEKFCLLRLRKYFELFRGELKKKERKTICGEYEWEREPAFDISASKARVLSFLELQCLSKLLSGLLRNLFLDALAFATDVTRVLPNTKRNKLGRRRECFFPPSKFVITSVVTIFRLEPDCTLPHNISEKKSLKYIRRLRERVD